MHIGAHFFNVNNLVTDGSYDRTKGKVGAILGSLFASCLVSPDSTIPLALQQSNEEVLFTSVPGGTGVGITAALILMVTSASEQIRSEVWLCVCVCAHLYTLSSSKN